MATQLYPAKVKSVAIILAAGSSSRMGRSKQLIKIANESLLRRTTKSVLASEVNATVVVLGSNYVAHQKEISDLPIRIVYNKEWQRGMGSSLKFATHYVQEQFLSCEAIIVAVSDQPLLTSGHLNNLLRSPLSYNSPLIASFYAGSPGVPVLFHRSMFRALMEIDDLLGAKIVLTQNINSAKFVDFPDGAVDLDTPDDWEKFSRSS